MRRACQRYIFRVGSDSSLRPCATRVLLCPHNTFLELNLPVNFYIFEKMRLAYLEEPETWKRAADILQKLAKNVDIFLQKSNKRFSKGTKVCRYPQFPKKFLYVKHQQKVSFIFESKIAIIFRRSPCRRFSRTSTKSFMSGN